jgi:glycine/D-amino acid oxidase-like deaminating enzyme
MAETHTAHGYWLEEAGARSQLPELEGDVRADVAIVGGGFTGLWTAWWILESEPDAQVVVLEAEGCGAGPSGRNGGFVNSMWFNVPALSARFGDRGAIAVAEAARDAVPGIARWCQEQRVEAWYRAGGYLLVSTTPAHDQAWERYADAAVQHGRPDACVPLDPEQVRGRCDSPLFGGGALFPDAATVQPARLALGLRDRLADRGASIHERSRALGVRASPSGVRVDTGRGRVLARSAVLALGPRCGLAAPLRRRLTVTTSHMVITEPVPDVLEEIGWTGGECISDSRAMVHYFRTTPDGRIAFGWAGGPLVPGTRVGRRSDVDRRTVAQIEQHLIRFFPQLAGRRLEHAWGGPIDVSPSHLPVVGTLGSDRVHYAFGYTGNGVGPSHFVGRSLASLALDLRDRWSSLPLVEPPPVRVPPEPLRYMGGSVVRRAVLRKERLEEEQRRADALTLAVAGLPELFGLHIGR